MFGWLRKIRPGGSTPGGQASQINTGVVHGDMIQITNGASAPPTRLTIPWTETPHDAIAGLLAWQSRIPETLHGRDEEMAELLRWADAPQAKSLFLLHGSGGVGKTRLAFEFAHLLQQRGWQAGELPDPGGLLALDLRAAGGKADILLVLDYPEEKRQATHDFLALVARLPEEKGRRLRILLLSRNASVLQELEGDAERLHHGQRELRPLDEHDADRHAHALFQAAWTRIQNIRGRDAAAPSPQAFRQWLERDPQHRKPLLILAHALNLSDQPEATNLDAGELIETLVKREIRRLKAEAKTLDMPETGYVLLKALAALTDGLDARQLARLRETAPNRPPLPELDALYRSREVREQRMEPLRPDLLAAQLLDQALRLCAPDTGAWLYHALTLAEEKQALTDATRRLGRLRHDWAFTLRAEDQDRTDPLMEALQEYALQNLTRCHTLGLALDRTYLERSLLPLSLAITQARVDATHGKTESEQAELARNLNILSTRLAESGDQPAALKVIQRAVNIRETLARDNFSAYAPNLANNLHTLSFHLAENGNQPAALVASRRAVEIIELFAKPGTVYADWQAKMQKWLHWLEEQEK